MLRLVFFCGSKSVSTLVSAIASWVSGPGEVDDCIKADIRVSVHRLKVLATRSRVVFLVRTSDFNESISTTCAYNDLHKCCHPHGLRTLFLPAYTNQF